MGVPPAPSATSSQALKAKSESSRNELKTLRNVQQRANSELYQLAHSFPSAKDSMPGIATQDDYRMVPQQELDKINRSAEDWQERARQGDDRVRGLLSESEQAADLMQR